MAINNSVRGNSFWALCDVSWIGPGNNRCCGFSLLGHAMAARREITGLVVDLPRADGHQHCFVLGASLI